MKEEYNEELLDYKYAIEFLNKEIKKEPSSGEELQAVKREDDTSILSHSPRPSTSTVAYRPKIESKPDINAIPDVARGERQDTGTQETTRQEPGRQERERLQNVIKYCGMCGHVMHTRAYQNCPASRRRCHNCNRIGHYRAFCWSRPRLPSSRNAYQFEIPAMPRAAGLRVRRCDSCGYRVHTRADRQCPAVFRRCFRCRRIGHYRIVCLSQQRRRYFPQLDPQSRRILLAAVRMLLQ